MASPGNPLASLLGPALTSLSAGAGGGAGGPGGGSDVPGEGQGGAGDQVSQLSSELHGADPAFLLRTLQSVKSALMAVFVHSGMRLPNVSGHVSQTIKALDRAIKEAQSAQATSGAVRPPLGFSGAGPGAPSQNQAGAGPMTPPPGA